MRYFWLLTGASALSKLGNTFLYLAVPWAVLSSTDSPLLAAMSLGCQTLPYLLSPFVGGLIDRYDRRRVFIVAEFGQAAAVGAIPLTMATGNVGVTFLCLFLVGCGGVASGITSDYGLVPSLAPNGATEKAYGYYSAALSIAKAVGPGLAGVTVATLGAEAALWIDMATFLITAVTAILLPRKQDKKDTESSITTMLLNGLQAFRKVPHLGRLTVVLCVHNIGAASLPVVILAVGKRFWMWDPGAIGFAVGAGAMAAALGGWIAPRVLGSVRHEKRITYGLVVCALGALGLLGFYPAIVISAYIVLMFGEGAMNVTTMVYRYRAIPQEYLGRVNAIVHTFAVSAMSLSSVVLGYASSSPNYFMAFVPASLLTVVSVLCWVWRPRVNGSMNPQETALMVSTG